MARHSDKKKLIFWAEDDLEDLEVFKRLLLDLAPDYDIVNFQNGQLLVNQLKALKAADYPNLIVLDMRMPVMNGIETLAYFKKHNEYDQIPRVIFTTSNNKYDKIISESYNTKMLTKPFALPDLHQTLHTILSFARVSV